VNGRRQVRVSEERVVLASDALRDLRVRLAHTRLPPDLGSGWDHGVPTDWLLRLLEDWRGFDTGALQDGLNGLHQLRAEVDGQALHVVQVEGRGPNPVPLLLTHGWPGSFLEYLAAAPAVVRSRSAWRRAGRFVHSDRAIATGLRIQADHPRPAD
jgi:hypothetical protein